VKEQWKKIKGGTFKRKKGRGGGRGGHPDVKEEESKKIVWERRP